MSQLLSPTGVPSPAIRRQARITAGLVATVILLSAIAPLATDMYVPAFPRVAGDLSATASQVQLTLTTFFVGMASGQLIGRAIEFCRRMSKLLSRGTHANASIPLYVVATSCMKAESIYRC